MLPLEFTHGGSSSISWCSNWYKRPTKGLGLQYVAGIYVMDQNRFSHSDGSYLSHLLNEKS